MKARESRPTSRSPSPSSPTDAILIVGTGALACLFAARLSAVGTRVTMLGTWPEGLAALKNHGVRITIADGSKKAYPVRATSDPQDCVGAAFALVLVKAWQTERAARQLARCLSHDGLALSLQNGLGNRERLAETLGESRVALGVTTTGATLVGPGCVRPGGEGTISLGTHSRISPVAQLLQRGGFSVEIVPQADDLLWSKLVINVAINPLTALLRVPNGELLNRPAARSLMASAAREAATVSASLGRNLTYGDPVAMAETVAHRTAANHSSMFQDVQRGAPTEIDAICGAVVTAGDEHSVPTPVNRTLWLLIKALVKGE